MQRFVWKSSRLGSAGMLLLLLGGCLLGVRMGEVMVMPVVGEYERLALAGLEVESDEVFREMFLATFPGTEFADRQAVSEIVPEDELLSARLGRDIGERLRSDLGAEALVAIVWEDSGMAGTLDWQMTITDTETGQVTGMVVARLRREPLARGASIEDLERRAFESLISALEERLKQ